MVVMESWAWGTVGFGRSKAQHLGVYALGFRFRFPLRLNRILSQVVLEATDHGLYISVIKTLMLLGP